MENPLYIVALSKIGFDFSNLSEDLQKSSSWILSGPKEYNAQIEILDDVTFQALLELDPDSQVLNSVSDIKELINQDLANNYNTMAYDPNDLLPAESDPVNKSTVSKQCLEILTAHNEDLNLSGFYIKTTYLDASKTPQVIMVIYYTTKTFVNTNLTNIFAFLEDALKSDFKLKYPASVSNKIKTLFNTAPQKWDNSILECTNTSILLFNDTEVVCTHKEPLKD